jgi:hypothetical protein
MRVERPRSTRSKQPGTAPDPDSALLERMEVEVEEHPHAPSPRAVTVISGMDSPCGLVIPSGFAQQLALALTWAKAKTWESRAI